jgi:hypothetical protein
MSDMMIIFALFLSITLFIFLTGGFNDFIERFALVMSNRARWQLDKEEEKQ